MNPARASSTRPGLLRSLAAGGLTTVALLGVALAVVALAGVAAAGVTPAGMPAAPRPGTQVEVLSAVAPAPPPGAPTMAVYLQLRNCGTKPDALVGVATPVAGEAMLHEQKLDGGMMRMRMLARLELPAGATVAMHSGGTHVMLAALATRPATGGRFPLRLRFERAGELTVQVQVLPPGSAP